MALALLFTGLIVIFIQDLMYRKIHVILPVLVFCALLWLVFNYFQDRILSIILFNAVFLTVTLGGLICYMSIKNKQIKNPFKTYFGLGDLLFYLAVTPAFILHNYIIFYISSMLFSIVVFLLFKKVLKDKTIPLAGFSALLLLVILLGEVFLSYSPLTLIRY